MEMESFADVNKMEQEQLQPPPGRRKGGFITMPFIIANEALEKVASYGLSTNMINYLMGEYHLGVAQSSNILFLWNAATNFLPVVGAFISDAYVGRFLTIGVGSISSLLGMVLIWLTAMIPQARPHKCIMFKEKCELPSSAQLALVLASFALMSIGAGGIRPCSLAFGANQLDTIDYRNKSRSRVFSTFFSWYYAATAIAVILAFTVIVYIQDQAGWKIGFGVPAILMFLSALFFFLASSIYVKRKPTLSLFTSFGQVIAVAYKNRKVPFPSEDSNGGYLSKKDVTEPTSRLRFLNKACIIRSPEDVTPDGLPTDPWSLCDVDQVEELKAVIRVFPLWSTGIALAINVSQGSFGLLQAKSMDRHIFGFQIPPGSFSMFTIAGAVFTIIIYDRAILPLASKCAGREVKLGLKMKMGIGVFFSFLAMASSAIIEHFRKREAVSRGYQTNPTGVVSMSALWLVVPHMLNGAAEAFNAVAQNEFFYSELSKRMSSFAAAFTGLGLAVGSLLASPILTTVHSVTTKGGKEGWITNNINRGHLESYYWLLAIVSAVNVLYFVLCSWAYGPCKEGGFLNLMNEFGDENEEELSDVKKEEELSEFGNGENKVGNGEKEEELSLFGNGENKVGNGEKKA